jgi:hypothetical protein
MSQSSQTAMLDPRKFKIIFSSFHISMTAALKE